jgi:hypothetical protein
MLSWFFKKYGSAPPPSGKGASSASSRAAVASAALADAAQRQAAKAQAQAQARAAQASAREAENWPGRVQQALGDDAALLAIASAAPDLDSKLAAVQALTGEDALRQAERTFRNHERKVHKLAKTRLETAVAQRTARARAEALLQHTEALLQDPLLPMNHVVALDRDWQALPALLLEPSQREAFDALRGQLDSKLREPAPAPAPAALPAPIAAEDSASSVAQEPTPEPPPEPAPEAIAAPAAAEAAPCAAAPEPAAPRQASAEQRARLDMLLTQAETALADGQSAALQQHLQAADALLLSAKGLAWPAALRSRQQALRAEQQRLKSWQSWGGHQAREALIDEAEALAQQTLAARDEPAQTEAAPVVDAAADPAAEPAAEPANPPATPPAQPPRRPRPKLNLRAHAESIHGLRMRWKALDKVGDGSGSHGALWQRFDAALTTAFQPVAAMQAQQQAARQQNLLARQALLDAVEAVPLDDGGNGDTTLREVARQLDAFQVAWRQLGPVEHTAPADARAGLLQRLQTAVERLDQPLRQARARASAEREQLIQRAQALLPADGRPVHGADLQRQLRELQAEWQEHARGLPLPRPLENALWTRFRAATDAVFAQREAAFAAHQARQSAEQAAEIALREGLLQRLAALGPQTPQAQINSTLSEVDRAWQQAPAVLQRAAGQALEARYREARSAASAIAETALRARWQAAFDALPAVPTAWLQSPAARAANAPVLGTQACDDLLLQLEMALDMPAAPEWQEARRRLKLQALKDTMEGRQPAPSNSGSVGSNTKPGAQALLALLQQPVLEPQQQARLQTVLQALRNAAPGSLGLPVPALPA